VESLMDYIFTILTIPAGLFLFLVLFSWIVALAADPYAGLPSEKDRKNLIKKRKQRRNKDAL
jgi:hypothetical protein